MPAGFEESKLIEERPGSVSRTPLGTTSAQLNQLLQTIEDAKTVESLIESKVTCDQTTNYDFRDVPRNTRPTRAQRRGFTMSVGVFFSLVSIALGVGSRFSERGQQEVLTSFAILIGIVSAITLCCSLPDCKARLFHRQRHRFRPADHDVEMQLPLAFNEMAMTQKVVTRIGLTTFPVNPQPSELRALSNQLAAFTESNEEKVFSAINNNKKLSSAVENTSQTLPEALNQIILDYAHELPVISRP